jgi:hypothetical protein
MNETNEKSVPKYGIGPGFEDHRRNGGQPPE